MARLPPMQYLNDPPAKLRWDLRILVTREFHHPIAAQEFPVLAQSRLRHGMKLPHESGQIQQSQSRASVRSWFW